jgi:hypothetical protein
MQLLCPAPSSLYVCCTCHLKPCNSTTPHAMLQFQRRQASHSAHKHIYSQPPSQQPLPVLHPPAGSPGLPWSCRGQPGSGWWPHSQRRTRRNPEGGGWGGGQQQQQRETGAQHVSRRCGEICGCPCHTAAVAAIELALLLKAHGSLYWLHCIANPSNNQHTPSKCTASRPLAACRAPMHSPTAQASLHSSQNAN